MRQELIHDHDCRLRDLKLQELEADGTWPDGGSSAAGAEWEEAAEKAQLEARCAP